MSDVKFHVIMIPWLAFGHMIPFLELAKCLAKRGHRVSFISTPRNIERLPSIPPNLSQYINLVPLTSPPIDGLPEHAQATIDVPLDQNHLLFELQDGLEGPIHSFLRDQSPPPDWIIFDMVLYWVPRMAHSFGVPSAYFAVFSAATMCFFGPPSALLAMAEQPPKISLEQLMVAPPWITFPSKVAFRYHEAVQDIKIFSLGPSHVSFGYRLWATIQGCTLVAIRTSINFEPESLRLLSDLYQKPVLPVGFLSPSPPPPPTPSAQEENNIWEEIQWLDAQKQASTVTELALGLDMSQLSFLWAYRGDPALLPMGFEDLVKSHGIIRMGWAPQPKFLAHESVGSFFTHAGWGSTIEGLSFGKPLVMLPMIADQGLNARVMEEEKVGVEVCRNEIDGSFTRDAVAKALRLVMVEKEGECIRENAREIQQNIFGDQSRNDQYIDEFLQYLIKYRGDEAPREQ
ncbi:putative UDP-rhamnose:rhamnosyltransferase 1 [Cinnamomum micranthum f. kanehirae]|uniref:Putative UDP-rhamnose:rhamnosyltransferase 1 n=1 Tax=Cinnamomum micranthum f. kanehirae TaxID=337451 RepID=A0A3S3MT00_9MAGN|nr:putative UDP-rhamnose:rhamnosyltransferase 1 [Cinnamomum micranthum f. kanehirae]